LFLFRNGEMAFPVPLNHKPQCEAGCDDHLSYMPFARYSGVVRTHRGGQILPLDYDAKANMPEGFVGASGRILKQREIIGSQERPGVNRERNQEGGYFKKVFKILRDGWAFAVVVKAKEGIFSSKNTIVQMGLGKNAFAVTISNDIPDWEGAISSMLSANTLEIAYAASDLYTSADIYEDCLFAVTSLAEYRPFITSFAAQKPGLRVEKQMSLYHFIRAGSVFILKSGAKERFEKRLHKVNAQAIGYNQIIYGGKKT